MGRSRKHLPNMVSLENSLKIESSSEFVLLAKDVRPVDSKGGFWSLEPLPFVELFGCYHR